MQKLLTFSFVLTLLAGATTVHADRHFNIYQPTITWTDCYPELAFLGEFQCGDIIAPLNYKKYRGGAPKPENSIALKLVRIPAQNPHLKQGTLFLNYGGPGGPAITNTIYLGNQMLTREVRDQYDIIGLDPRGIGESTPLKCFANYEEFTPYLSIPSYPKTVEEELDKVEHSNFIAKACETRGGELYKNMTTADVARDLEWLRRAVGDSELNFYGMSYGSYVGATYANMYPHRVGKIIVDGVIDPVAWATGRGFQSWFEPVTSRLRSDKSSADSLGEFYRLCRLAGANCPIAEAPERAMTNAFTLVENYDIYVTDQYGNMFILSEQNLVQEIISTMYSPLAWKNFADFIAQLAEFYDYLESQTAPFSYEPQLQSINAAYARYKADLYGDETVLEEGITETIEEPILTGLEWFSNVMCSDSNNPRSAYSWINSGFRAEQKYGLTGAYWNWSSAPCAHIRPSRSRYAGPFRRWTKNPILIISTYFDPATALEGAVALHRLMPNSHLLPVEGWGHVSFLASQCADEASAEFLINGNLPEAGTVCEPSATPFNLSVETATSDIQAPATIARHYKHWGHHDYIDDRKQDARKRLNRMFRNKQH